MAAPQVATAGTTEPEPADDPYFIPHDELPSGVINGDPAPQYQTSDGPPAEVAQALLRLTLDRPDLRVSGTEWDADTGQLLLYSAAGADSAATALESAGLADAVQYRPAVLDASEKAEISTQIAGEDGSLPSGQQVTLVEPSLDGSTFSVVLDETVSSSMRLDVSALKAEIASRVDERVEVTIDIGPPVEAAVRNHAANPSTFGGAVMRRTGTTAICTTGFRMTQISGNVPVMGSAHHCHEGVENQAWHYTSLPDPVYPVANATSIYGPGLSNGDVSVWKGPMADHMLPAIFIGDHTVAGSGLYGIRGALASPVGATVCYSGSLSGTMCNNTIQATGLTVCYGGGLPCYNNIVRTEQATGMPAAGRGDSGGPVYRTNNGIYAAGIISGIVNATPTCSGEPGSSAPNGRICSPIVLYAPITELMSNGYGINVVPYHRLSCGWPLPRTN